MAELKIVNEQVFLGDKQVSRADEDLIAGIFDHVKKVLGVHPEKRYILFDYGEEEGYEVILGTDEPDGEEVPIAFFYGHEEFKGETFAEEVAETLSADYQSNV